MKLLELADGMVSLEFQPSERDRLMERLGQFGSIKRRPEATHVKVSVGSEKFIYQDDWDEPCLISTSKAGANLLRQLSLPSARSVAA